MKYRKVKRPSGRIDTIRYMCVTCPQCGISREIQIRSFKDISRVCKPCSRVNIRRPLDTLSLFDLIDLFFAGCVVNRRSKYINSQGRNFGPNMVELLEKLLRMPITTTNELKVALLSYFLKQPKTTIFQILTRILEKHRKMHLASPRGGSWQEWVISDGTSKIFSRIFDVLGFSYTFRSSGQLRIKSASFFIDGRWLHIG